VDGQKSAEISTPFQLTWRLSAGAHRVDVEAGGVQSAPVTFDVLGPPTL